MKKILAAATLFVVALGGCQQGGTPQGRIAYPNAVAQPPQVIPSPMEIEQLRQSAKASPKKAEVWTALGDALMDSQQFGEAINAYQKALALNPTNVSVRVDMGTCYRGVGQFDKAVEEYRKALTIDPNFAYGHRNLGVVLAADLHDGAGAIKEFRRYLELRPDAPDAAETNRLIQKLSATK